MSKSPTLCLTLLLAAGCMPPSGKLARPDRGQSDPSRPAALAVPSPPADAGDQAAARGAAEDFLHRVVAVEPKPAELPTALDRLSPAAKKRLSGTLVFEQDKKAGFSADDVTKRLRETFAGFSGSSVQHTAVLPTKAGVRGELSGSTAKAGFTLRLVKVGEAWKIDRFGRSAGAVLPPPPAYAWASEVAQEFLDAAIANDAPGAGDVTSADFRRQVAPPATESDRSLGYDAFRLGNWLKGRLAGATGYSAGAVTAEGSGAVLRGDLTAGDKRVPFVLKLVPAGGDWAVGGFETQAAK
jgi:hypothetical protein